LNCSHARAIVNPTRFVINRQGRPEHVPHIPHPGTAAAPAPALDMVLAAAAAAGEATTAQLADATGLGRSTVTKALASLEATGRARRAPGGRDGARVLPDRWQAVTDPSTCDPSHRPAAAPPSRRLRRGELGELVLSYMSERVGLDLSPTAVAAALGRSAGAVGNALGRLAAAGALTQSSVKPRRFTCPPPTPTRESA
jgi:hypothetical protein